MSKSFDNPIICFLADDDEDDREIFSLALEEAGLPVHLITVKNGREAVDHFHNPVHPLPDVIFLDLNMPLMDGKELLHQIKRFEHLQHVPVFIYTTSTNNADKDEAIAMGAAAFVTKLPSVSQLAKTLTDILQIFSENNFLSNN